MGLKENLDRYFIKTKKSKKIDIRLLRIKKRDSAELKRTRNYMELSYNGKYSKRKPISVKENKDGTYTVLDGNATSTVAKQEKWKYIRAEIKEREKNE